MLCVFSISCFAIFEDRPVEAGNLGSKSNASSFNASSNLPFAQVIGKENASDIQSQEILEPRIVELNGEYPEAECRILLSLLYPLATFYGVKVESAQCDASGKFSAGLNLSHTLSFNRRIPSKVYYPLGQNIFCEKHAIEISRFINHFLNFISDGKIKKYATARGSFFSITSSFCHNNHHYHPSYAYSVKIDWHRSQKIRLP